MRERLDPPAALLALATAQAGVVSAEQADLVGFGRHSRQRLLEQGQWRRLEGPVYAVHPLEVDWLGTAWAGILLGGASSRLAGLAAAHLYQLVEEPPRSLDVLVPVTARARIRPPWVFTRERPGARSPLSPGHPPRTTVEDTVLDLCDGSDPGAVVGWVTQAVGSGRTSAVRLSRALAGRHRFASRAFMAEILGDVGEGVHSPLELRYLRDVERPHGLPRGDRQNWSRHRHRRDVVYEEFGLVVELDGRLGHVGLGKFRDMNRDNLAATSGELTLRYGSADVAGSACVVAWQVFTVLTGRGYRDPFRRCPNCALVPDGAF
ncbi:hypothetical protein [uncultured Friedmanniella sp.]|uniref:hypothetical protein n=1 Tax=uncultured Friedmanniella sp. TaxID=335381 RepID=UPI0035CAB19F